LHGLNADSQAGSTVPFSDLPLVKRRFIVCEQGAPTSMRSITQHNISQGDSVPKLGAVVPRHNEQQTLAKLINKVLQIADDSLTLEIYFLSI
jgi:hypothetical protein